MNRRALLLVITGFVAAIAAAVVIFFLITNLTPKEPPVIETIDTTERRVVAVAAVNIAVNTRVSAAQVATGTFPIDMIPADAVTNLDDILDKSTTMPILSGQILQQQQFVTGTLSIASANVEPGKVMVAFPSTDMLNATGAVQKGDYVDILLSIPISGTTRLDAAADSGTQLQSGERTLVAQGTLQNVQVFNVGQWAPPGQQADNAANNQLKIISFIVAPQEALILKYVKDSGGTIDLAVRSDKDKEVHNTVPVTLDYLVDVYDFIGLPPLRTATPVPPPAATPAPAP